MRAVVLGAGIAGLAAASALATQNVDVIVIEKDDLPPHPAPRPGVPQGRQLHNLLGRGQLHLDRLFPGFCAEVRAGGGVQAHVSTETHVYEIGIDMPERDVGLEIISAPQPLLEHTARRLLPDGVQIRSSCSATGLSLSDDSVSAVVTDRGRIDTDLVVDAMGARSPVSRWLPHPPSVDVFESRHWYVTLEFQRPEPHFERSDFWLTFPTASGTRAGMLSPAGPRRWRASVSGIRGHDPVPTSVDQFRRHLSTLESTAIADVLVEATEIGKPVVFQRPTMQWRRYDVMRQVVPGLFPIGDSFAVLDPLLGQGISVATWQAAGLVIEGGHDVEALTHRYLAVASQAATQGWQLSTADFAHSTGRSRSLDASAWQRIADRVRTDPNQHRRYVRVWHLLEPVDVFHDLAETAEGTTPA